MPLLGAAVPVGQTTALWLTVAVPTDATPGVYSAVAVVEGQEHGLRAGAVVQVSIPLQLEVWDLELPSLAESSFSNFFQFQFQPHPFGAVGAQIRGVLEPYYGQRTQQVKQAFFDTLCASRPVQRMNLRPGLCIVHSLTPYVNPG